MLSSAVVAFAKFVGFIILVACAITTFYAAIHTININNPINVFFAGLVALLIGLVAGPLYCVISFYGLDHYLAIPPLGSLLLVAPVFLAWCYMVFYLAAAYLRG